MHQLTDDRLSATTLWKSPNFLKCNPFPNSTSHQQVPAFRPAHPHRVFCTLQTDRQLESMTPSGSLPILTSQDDLVQATARIQLGWWPGDVPGKPWHPVPMLPRSLVLATQGQAGEPVLLLGAQGLPPPCHAPRISQLFGGAGRGQDNPNPRGWEFERQMWANFLA